MIKNRCYASVSREVETRYKENTIRGKAYGFTNTCLHVVG